MGGHEPATSIPSRIPTTVVGVSVVTIGEVHQGAYNSSNPEARIQRFDQFLMRYATVDVSRDVMARFAEVRAGLGRQGMLVADLDLIIAATALHYDLTLLTFNRRHFQRVSGLRLYEPGPPQL